MRTKTSPQLISRLKGSNGRARLADVLRNQILVAGDETVAAKLSEKAKTRQLAGGVCIIDQGAADNDLHFLLSGSCSICVNGREIAVRKAGEHVGEVALLDTVALRSATVKTAEATLIATVTEKHFAQVASAHPQLWRRMAMVLANRLRDRNRFHPAPREQPAIFIGSSSKRGIQVAEYINKYLSKLPVVPRLWSRGVFEASDTAIEDLVRASTQVDFAALVLTGDDITRSRGKNKSSPRDNVIFELGLFMGALGRNRTYMVAPRSLDLKIPTDLLGVNQLRFTSRRGQTMARNLKAVLQQLRTLIEKYGPM